MHPNFPIHYFNAEIIISEPLLELAAQTNPAPNILDNLNNDRTFQYKQINIIRRIKIENWKLKTVTGALNKDATAWTASTLHKSFWGQTLMPSVKVPRHPISTDT